MRTLQPRLFGPALVLGLGLLAASVHAQSAPGVITNFANDAVFNSTNLGNLGIYASGGTRRLVIRSTSPRATRRTPPASGPPP